jgi:hypothetical protein
LVSASCQLSTDKLLSVQTPDVIAPGTVNNASGAEAERVGAIVRFASMVNGGLGYAVIDGLFTDQLVSGRQQLNFIDQRAWDQTQVYEIYYFWSFQEQAERAITAMLANSPNDATRKAHLAELYALIAVGYIFVGETNCNGFPVGHLPVGGTATYELNLTVTDGFNRALAYLDSAAALATDPNIVNLVAVERARALLNMATGPSDPKFAQAATAVANVPTTFRYDASYNTVSLNNGINQWIQSSGNFSVADNEGINGLNYRSSGDPRIGVYATARARLGQDGNTEIFFPRQGSALDTPTPIASGTEARLIEAEVALAGGNSNWLTILNTLRTANPPWPGSYYVSPTTTGPCTALPANLTDPGTDSARVSLIMRERAFWMFLTAHRTGDLRRLVRQYGRNKDAVFPTGPYFHGGTYGQDYNMPVTQHDWSLIPGYAGCTDRNI